MTGVRMTGWYRWVAVAALVVLSACGGGKKSTVPEPMVSSIVVDGLVGDGTPTRFIISGTNLRNAIVGIENCASDLVTLAATNQQFIFSCTRTRQIIPVTIKNSSTNELVAEFDVDAINSSDPIAEPTADPLSPSTPAFNTKSTFSITGTNLSKAQIDMAFGCAQKFNHAKQVSVPIDFVYNTVSDTEIRFTCTPSDKEIRLNLKTEAGVPVSVVSAQVPLPTADFYIQPSSFNAPDSNEVALLGKMSNFDIIKDGLPTGKTIADVKFVSDDCSKLSVENIKISCIPKKYISNFKIVDATDESITLAEYSVNFSSLEKEPLRIRAIIKTPVTEIFDGTVARLLSIGQRNYFSVSGFFDQAEDINISANGCTNIADQEFDSERSVFTFSCELQSLGASLTLSDQSDNRTLATMSPPIQIRFDISINGSAIGTPILVNLDYRNAPATVANFLSYFTLDTELNTYVSDYYKNTIIHRMLNTDGATKVIQGGAFTSASNVVNGIVKPGGGASIPFEVTNISNSMGTIAMARTDDPDSASSQFFFNVTDNSSAYSYKSPTNPGYAAFGKAATRGTEQLLEAINGITVDSNGIPIQTIRLINVFRLM